MTTNANQQYVLGLDPGGSKCEALLIRSDGTVERSAFAQLPGASGRSVPVIRQSIRDVLGDAPPVNLELATSCRLPALEELGLESCCQSPIHTFSETDGPLALIGERKGVVVVAGTGARVSAVFDGREITMDGLGPLLGDRGGAYDIGRQAMRAAARSVEHPRQATSLREPIFAACEAYHVPLPSYMEPLRHDLSPEALRLRNLIGFSLANHDRSVLASLARIVDEQASAGDRIALGILRGAATSLAETFGDVVDTVAFADQSFPVIGIGSVAAKSNLYWEHFCQLARISAPAMRPQRVRLPVVGIALAALLERPGIDAIAVRKKLLASAESHYQQKVLTS